MTTHTNVKGWRNPRPITERIVVEGKLVLQTPAHFNSGDSAPASQVDLTLLRNSRGHIFLPGASIAGALRSYLRDREQGYHQSETEGGLTTLLFGMTKNDEETKEGEQSRLIVDDSVVATSAVEMRDGVRIEPETRTAADKAKFDMEVIAAGTAFPLRFELLICADDDSDKIRHALATALAGFENGEITMGGRKRRGLGQVKVAKWHVTRYDLTAPDDFIGWLTNEPSNPSSVDSIFAGLKAEPLGIDKRDYFTLEATFSLNGPLLVRSNGDTSPDAPDMVHLQARQSDGALKPILPGTSLTGVVRHHALRIATTLHGSTVAEPFVANLFGRGPKAKRDQRVEKDKQHVASRFVAGEAVVKNVKSLIQSRIRIDRFTGGAYETALFEEQPVFGGDDSRLELAMIIRNPKPYEIGLLLLVLKDLWSSDLPVGGGSSVGRGRLQGVEACLALQEYDKHDKLMTWCVKGSKALSIEGNVDQLEAYVTAFCDYKETKGE
ncbi:MAG: hypothetical protein KDJ65_30295 [Anaerolineae bacterium]|nr:hypothetical protein [Anaerolineae bacterium]